MTSTGMSENSTPFLAAGGHYNPTNQPSGNSGARLGCGNIYAYAVPILETYMK
ncbi:MAG: hypothetical protein RR090_04625 [Niameybacter sp.]|uniref:hypothetical protein n=1 Tax=Niameybacter sp. TaxID=2033640 RepID=UPI002FCA0F56